MILLIVVLFVLGSVLTGLTFYSMTWAGQHVLRDHAHETSSTSCTACR